MKERSGRIAQPRRLDSKLSVLMVGEASNEYFT
jgi:hypothetical protein